MPIQLTADRDKFAGNRTGAKLTMQNLPFQTHVTEQAPFSSRTLDRNIAVITVAQTRQPRSSVL